MDRRGFLGILASAGLVGLAGCTGASPGPAPTGRGSASNALPSDDDELRRSTFAAEQELVGLYAAAIVSADPELAEQLRTLQAQHIEHAQRLLPEASVSTDPPTPAPSVTASPTAQAVQPSAATGSTSSSPTGGPARSAGATPDPTPTPSPSAVLAGLRRAEQAALAQRSAACDGASAPELARSLCLIAASEGQHVDVLTAWRARLTE